MEQTHQICRRRNGNWRCNKLPPDEERCCLTGGGGWRCTNFRMGHGAADDDTIPKTNRCEKHYYYYVNYHKNLKEKKRSGDGEETKGWKRRKKNIRTTSYNDTPDVHSGPANIGTQRKNVGKTELDFTDFLTKNRPMITSNKLMKKNEETEKKVPPDEQRCAVKGGGLAGGGRWRCKNFRMGYGADTDDDVVPKTRYCEKHYILREKIKKRLRDGEVPGRGHIEETRGDNGTENQNVGATSHHASVTIVEGGTGNIRRRKIVERMEGSRKPESSATNRERLVEFESMETYKSKCFELCVELEKKKLECTELQGKLVDVVEIKKTDPTEQTPADAAERWRKMLSEFESQVWGMESSNRAIAVCTESPISIFESLVPSSRPESSILEKSNKPFVNLVSDDDSE